MIKTLKSSIKITQLAVPIILMNAVSSFGGFIAMNFMGKLGQVELAAGALIYSIYGLVFSLAFAFLLPISIFVGKEYAAKTIHNIGFIVRDGLVVATAFGMFSFIILMNLSPLLVYCGQSPVLIKITVKYFNVAIFSILPLMWSLVFNQFYFGIARPHVVLMISILNLPITIFMNYIFIFGKFGLPAYGVAGSAFASIIGAWVNLFLLIIFSLLKKEIRNFLSNVIKFGASHFILKLFNLGWPIAVQRGSGNRCIYCADFYYR